MHFVDINQAQKLTLGQKYGLKTKKVQQKF